MEIRYFASMRDVTGEPGRQWDYPAPTLRDLLHGLSGVYGETFEQVILRHPCSEREKLNPLTGVLVNGRLAKFTGGLDTPLSPEDEICLCPSVSLH